MRSTATGSFLMEKTPDMPDDPRPEPVAMTDDEIAKLAPLKGEESFSVRFAVNVDLEPNCKGPCLSWARTFASSPESSFETSTGKAFFAGQTELKTSTPATARCPSFPKKLRKRQRRCGARFVAVR